ncbi:hypothetical protein NUKP32_49360 [Klebsiella variicola]|uniref:ead/Ea22-like family protein n=1 Tax=Klebsiella variicola TaxID=244366 RepID=UPI0021814B9D|nr:ead/Ea22-like family protein [Klebsiella variicola]GKJ60148.1 hypothetical protein NUKP32_49360 [Klebsiella variicola]
MTTDIELAQSLKRRATSASEFGESLYVKADNILALVEALEKAQQRNDELLPSNRNMLMPALEGLSRDHLVVTIQTVVDNYSSLHTKWLKDRQRIAELESRTVTVKQGEVLVTVAGFTGCGKSAIAGEIEIAMKAIGVPVTWANGDSEKRMTGADWLTAIEMYKPTVRIVEENIPRAAGIKVEAE